MTASSRSAAGIFSSSCRKTGISFVFFTSTGSWAAVVPSPQIPDSSIGARPRPAAVPAGTPAGTCGLAARGGHPPRAGTRAAGRSPHRPSGNRMNRAPVPHAPGTACRAACRPALRPARRGPPPGGPRAAGPAGRAQAMARAAPPGPPEEPASRPAARPGTNRPPPARLRTCSERGTRPTCYPPTSETPEICRECINSGAPLTCGGSPAPANCSRCKPHLPPPHLPLTATRGIAGDPGTLGHAIPSLEISERTVEVRERLTCADTVVCDLLASILITRHERVNNALKQSELQPYVESRAT